MGSFAVDMNRFANKATKNIDQVCRKATVGLFKNIAEKSPVDTGHFSGNWQSSQNIPITTTTEIKDTSRAHAIAQAEKALSFKTGGIVWFTNNLPYASRLEYGWSKQAPAGMVRVSIREFDNNINQLAAAAK